MLWLPYFGATFYTYHLEMKMMVNKHENVLKGQHNLAQGKRRRSVALGCIGNAEIVRAQLIFKDKI